MPGREKEIKSASACAQLQRTSVKTGKLKTGKWSIIPFSCLQSSCRFLVWFRPEGAEPLARFFSADSPSLTRLGPPPSVSAQELCAFVPEFSFGDFS
jgi:hypothetical protein